MPRASQFSALFSAVGNLQWTLSSSGLAATIANEVPGYVGQNGVMPFDANWQNNAYQCAAALGYGLPYAMFNPNAAAQPRVPQVQIPHQTANNINLMLIHYANGLSDQSYLYSQMRRRGTQPELAYAVEERRRGDLPYHLLKVQAASAKDKAAAAGAVAVGGGTGLIAASGTTYATLATASIGSLTLFTAGVALIVVGVGVAGYYGWQYLSSPTNVSPVAYYSDDVVMRPPYEIEE